MTRPSTCAALTVVSLIGAACSGPVDVAQLRAELVGEYRLIANSEVVDSRFESSDLALMADGRSRLRCKYKDGRVAETTATWEVSSVPSVFFSRFLDCAGVFKTFGDNAAASLLVERTNPPSLILDPDIVGVFYEKVK